MFASRLAVLVCALCACCASLALATDGLSPAGRYVGSALGLLQQIESTIGAISQAGDTIAARMVAGHSLYLGGSYEGFIVEGYYRAGGMMKAGWLKKAEDLKAGDVLLLGTVEAADPKDVALADEARKRGALVVRIGPGGRQASPGEIDLTVPCKAVTADREAGTLPLASVGDIMTLWALTGEIAGGCTRRGKMTPMFQSVLVPGGIERNKTHLELQWEPTCPPAQKQGFLGRTYLARLGEYLRALQATQLGKFAEAGRLAREAKQAGHHVYVIPFGHLPPYETALAADPGVFEKLAQDTNGQSLTKVVRQGDVVLYIGYYELPPDIAKAAHDAGAKIVSFVSGKPDRPATQMGADINIVACWPFGDAAVEIPGYDVAILPPSGVMTSVAYWMLVAEAMGDQRRGRSDAGQTQKDSKGKTIALNDTLTHSAPIPLWRNGAPGLDTATPQETPTITPYLLEDGKVHGAVIVCPGGGYAGRAPHEAEPISRWLNRAGFHSFVCAYRVAPYKHPYPMLDAQRAIRWVRFHAEEYNIDPKHIGILGFSAGGHLVSTVGTHFDQGNPAAIDPIDRVGCRPDALILCYPVISFGPYGHHGSMVNLIGENPPEELRLSLCNELQVTAQTPPSFLWHTANDEGVPVENSLLFAEALSKYKVPFELHIFQSGPHGMGLAESDPHVHEWTNLCETWLKRLGF
jgi:acetyl esterase/lipase